MIIDLSDNLKKRVVSPFRTWLAARFGDRNAFKRYATHMFEGGRMDPRELAEFVIDRVEEYCSKVHDHSLECMADHSPDQFEVFIDAYLPNWMAEWLEKAIGNSDTFWDEVKKEYEKEWKEWWVHDIAYHLDDELKVLFETLAYNDLHLSDPCRVKRLKAYEELLNGFKDMIRRALKEGKPLTELELWDWYKKMGEAVYGYKNNDYEKEVTYYLNYYDMLDDGEKLEILNALLNDYIDSDLHYIKEKLFELGALTNQS